MSTERDQYYLLNAFHSLLRMSWEERNEKPTLESLEPGLQTLLIEINKIFFHFSQKGLVICLNFSLHGGRHREKRCLGRTRLVG